MFTVIKIIQYYEDIDEVKCVEVCQTEDEANDLAIKFKDEIDEAWRKRIEYVNSFVDNIQIPELDYHGWLKWIETWPGVPCTIRPEGFKSHLRSSLIRDYTLDNKDYNPPKVEHGYASFYVLK